jgi:hypothetical protein
MWIQAHVHTCDVSVEREFQRRFTGFYRVRRNDTWRRAYFGLLEASKQGGVSFRCALTSLLEDTHQIEASFASKLVATIDDSQPVIDSVVLKHVGLRLPPASTPERISRVVDVFESLSHWYQEQLCHPRGIATVRLFREAYPAAHVSDLKALDLVLWQVRARA